MIDAHFHRAGGVWFRLPDGAERRFYGIHPWDAETHAPSGPSLAPVRAALLADPAAGVGEIGLDRLKTKHVTDAQRQLFRAQLELAADLRRRVVLHGAKCWGEVLATIEPYADRVPAFLFHGFSRAGGLIPRIVRAGGYFSVGAALLNDHAVNYRALVAGIPAARLLIETDVADAAPEQILARLAALRGETPETTRKNLEIAARAFWGLPRAVRK